MKKSTRIPTATIENCTFEFECPKRWSELTETPFEAIRHCPTCQKDVHLCKDSVELEYAQHRGWCVAINRMRFNSFETTLGKPASFGE